MMSNYLCFLTRIHHLELLLSTVSKKFFFFQITFGNNSMKFKSQFDFWHHQNQSITKPPKNLSFSSIPLHSCSSPSTKIEQTKCWAGHLTLITIYPPSHLHHHLHHFPFLHLDSLSIYPHFLSPLNTLKSFNLKTSDFTILLQLSPINSILQGVLIEILAYPVRFWVFHHFLAASAHPQLWWVVLLSKV